MDEKVIPLVCWVFFVLFALMGNDVQRDDKMCYWQYTHCVIGREVISMNMQKLIKELRKQSGMNMKEFSYYFKIPYHTYQDWEYGKREMPEYLLRLITYKLKMEGIIFHVPEELED